MMNNSRTILHVDDDPQMTKFISARLEQHGYQTVSLHDPALVMKEVIQNKFRVILLDIDMPGQNGIELLDEIKIYDGGIQVVMLTGVVNMTTVLKSLRAGAEACFFKPVDDIQPLVEAIDDIFRKIDRWWNSLEDLHARKQSDKERTVTNVATG